MRHDYPNESSEKTNILLPVVVLLVLAAIAVGLFVFAARKREQRIHEKVLVENVMTLTSTNSAVQKEARAKVAKATSRDVEFLIKTLNSAESSSKEKSEATRALGVIGSGATNAFPSLLKAAESEDRVLRSAAMYALGRVPGNPAVAVPFYINQLSSPDANTRYRAAENLGRAGITATQAVTALKLTCSDLDPKVRLAATNSLIKLGVASLHR